MRYLFSSMIVAAAFALASPGQLQAQCRGGACYSGSSSYGTGYCGNVSYSNCGGMQYTNYGGGMRYSNCGGGMQYSNCGGGMQYSNCGNSCGGRVMYSSCGTSSCGTSYYGNSCGGQVYYYGGNRGNCYGGYCGGMRVMSGGSCSSCVGGSAPAGGYEAVPDGGAGHGAEKIAPPGNNQPAPNPPNQPNNPAEAKKPGVET